MVGERETVNSKSESEDEEEKEFGGRPRRGGVVRAVCAMDGAGELDRTPERHEVGGVGGGGRWEEGWRGRHMGERCINK